MAYIKYKEVTKYFNFSKSILTKDLPKYVLDYIFEDEVILQGYKTSKDYGVFTDKKIVLFDNSSTFGISKEIFTIPYKTISTISVIFKMNGAEVSLFLNSGYPLRLKFVDMHAEDKLRLRILYTCISRSINNQELSKDDVKRLQENDISFKN